MKIKDEWTPKCYPSGGSLSCPDTIGRRTGNAPLDKLAQVLRKTAADAKAAVSKKQVAANVCVLFRRSRPRVGGWGPRAPAGT